MSGRWMRCLRSISTVCCPAGMLGSPCGASGRRSAGSETAASSPGHTSGRGRPLSLPTDLAATPYKSEDPRSPYKAAPSAGSLL